MAHSSATEKHLVYFCYGSELIFQQTKFSLWTALSFAEKPDFSCTIYTDQPQSFEGLPVKTKEVTAQQLTEWSDNGKYIHRRKAFAIMDALKSLSGCIAFLDADTYFRRNPEMLFDMVGPGRACMHVREGTLKSTGLGMDRTISLVIENVKQRESSFPKLQALAIDEPLWNSGVIAIHSSDSYLLTDMIEMIDQLWSLTEVNHVEQLIVGHLLSRIKLRQTRGIVFHYWPAYLKVKFNESLRQHISSKQGAFADNNFWLVYRKRPRAMTLRGLRSKVGERLRACGLPIRGVAKNA